MLVLVLDHDEWDRLEAASTANERDPNQHARWLVLRGLDAASAAPDAEPEPVEVAS
jgi:hypothetical protein